MGAEGTQLIHSPEGLKCSLVTHQPFVFWLSCYFIISENIRISAIQFVYRIGFTLKWCQIFSLKKPNCGFQSVRNLNRYLCVVAPTAYPSAVALISMMWANEVVRTVRNLVKTKIKYPLPRGHYESSSLQAAQHWCPPRLSTPYPIPWAPSERRSSFIRKCQEWEKQNHF